MTAICRYHADAKPTASYLTGQTSGKPKPVLDKHRKPVMLHAQSVMNCYIRSELLQDLVDNR